MTGWFNPDNWLDLVSQVLLIIGGLSMAIVPSIYAAKAHRTGVEVLSETRNGHKVPMRQDLDRAIAAIEAISEDVRGLRRDLLAEEEHRRLQIQDLRSDLDHRTGKHRRI